MRHYASMSDFVASSKSYYIAEEQCHSTSEATEAQRNYLRVGVYVGGYFVCADAPAEQMKSLVD